jgi:glycosyltransferase involved in cell wall biosynthesis
VSRVARVAVVTSHPIQYHSPWFRALAQVVDLEVFYCHRQDAAAQAAAGFGQPFEWDIPLLEGYRYRWLENISPTPHVDFFRGCDTPGVAPLIREGGYDACVVTGWYLKSYWQAIRACWNARVPILMRGDSHLGSPRSAVKTAAKFVPYAWMLRRMDAHLFVGEANRAYLRHYGVPESQLFFTPHFVENDRFNKGADRARENGAAAAFRAAAGVPPGAVVFLFAGKLIVRKRVIDFVQALAGLRASGRLVHGIVVGSGPEESDVRQQAQMLGAPVHFAGFLNQTELPVAYAAADCFVLPSSTETWGLVVNEAMACGLPAIVSDGVGCATDLVVPGETGFVYPAGDAPQLWDRMLRLVDLLDRDRSAFDAAVRSRISRYACDDAVAGTLSALEFVTPSVRRLSAITPALSRGNRP